MYLLDDDDYYYCFDGLLLPFSGNDMQNSSQKLSQANLIKANAERKKLF
jgi:hypothetical protein